MTCRILFCRKDILLLLFSIWLIFSFYEEQVRYCRDNSILKYKAILFLLNDIPDQVNSLINDDFFYVGPLRAEGLDLFSDLGFFPRNIFSSFSIKFSRVSNF